MKHLPTNKTQVNLNLGGMYSNFLESYKSVNTTFVVIYDPELRPGFAASALLVVMKDSPQPHCPFKLGLININSDLLGNQIETCQRL